MLKQIVGILKKNGVLIGVVPALDSVLHTSMLVYEKYWKQFKDKTKAQKKTAKIIGHQDYDFSKGILDYQGKQKIYYYYELLYRLHKAGFTNVKIEKLIFPWHSLEDKKVFFPKHPKPWDWLFIAKK